jgi:hypothetical protein
MRRYGELRSVVRADAYVANHAMPGCIGIIRSCTDEASASQGLVLAGEDQHERHLSDLEHDHIQHTRLPSTVVPALRLANGRNSGVSQTW